MLGRIKDDIVSIIKPQLPEKIDMKFSHFRSVQKIDSGILLTGFFILYNAP